MCKTTEEITNFKCNWGGWYLLCPYCIPPNDICSVKEWHDKDGTNKYDFDEECWEEESGEYDGDGVPYPMFCDSCGSQVYNEVNHGACQFERCDDYGLNPMQLTAKYTLLGLKEAEAERAYDKANCKK